LEHVQTLVGEGQCFEGVRTVTPHPDGKTLYACSFRAGTLSVLERDPATGKLNVKQVVRDEQDGVHGLAGTMSACVSSDGKFVYNTSGRFDGDDAVSVFEIGADGKLKVIQEFINEQGELKDFTGGNELAISPDEKSFYAAGTTSCSLACFRRDPATGKLTYLTTVRNEATGDGVDLGANGIATSSDGRFLYLALENVGGISVFERRLGP
jgi:6-phosphogluconolactonase (cycloisomerase 2 family)